MKKLLFVVFLLLGCSHARANPHIATTSVPGGQVAVPYETGLLAYGGQKPYAWSVAIGTLPSGLALSASTGTISGTPTATGVSTFTVQVTDSTGKSASQQYSINIIPAPLVIGCPGTLVGSVCTLPAGQVNLFYSVTIPVSGGVPPYTFTILSGALPPGLNLTFNQLKEERFLRDLESL